MGLLSSTVNKTIIITVIIIHTLYCVCVITSGRTRGAAAEDGVVREQQLKQMQSGSSSWRWRSQGTAAEADAIRKQQLKRSQSGSSSWSRCNQGTVWSDHMRLVLARDTTAQGCWCVRVGVSPRLTQTWWRRWDHRSIPMYAARQELSCTMLC